MQEDTRQFLITKCVTYYQNISNGKRVQSLIDFNQLDREEISKR